MKNLLLLVILITTFTSASAQTKISEKKIGHIYYFSVPDYMLKTYELNDYATLQYQNKAKEAYVIIIDDSKEEMQGRGVQFADLREYYDNFISSFTQSLQDVTTKDPVTLTINGNKAIQTEIDASMDGIGISYMFTGVETPTHFYKILCWTTRENKSILFPDYKKISSTLREGN